MSDESGCVTLIFYRIATGTDIFKEPFLNILAAAFQMSSFTHVEIAIGRTKLSTHYIARKTKFLFSHGV